MFVWEGERRERGSVCVREGKMNEGESARDCVCVRERECV